MQNSHSKRKQSPKKYQQRCQVFEVDLLSERAGRWSMHVAQINVYRMESVHERGVSSVFLSRDGSGVLQKAHFFAGFSDQKKQPSNMHFCYYSFFFFGHISYSVIHSRVRRFKTERVQGCMSIGTSRVLGHYAENGRESAGVGKVKIKILVYPKLLNFLMKKTKSSEFYQTTIQ